MTINKKNKSRFSLKDKVEIINDFEQILSPYLMFDKEQFKEYTSEARFYGFNGPLFIYFSIVFVSRDEGAFYTVDISVENKCCPPEFNYARPRELIWPSIKELILVPYDYLANMKVSLEELNTVLYREHKSKYQQIIKYIKNDINISFFKSMILDEIIKGLKHCNHFIHDNDIIMHCLQPIMIATWCGEFNKAKECLEWGYSVLKRYYNEDNIQRLIKQDYIETNTVKRKDSGLVCIETKREFYTGDKEVDSFGFYGGNRNLQFTCLKKTQDDYDRIIQSWYEDASNMIKQPEVLRDNFREFVNGNMWYCPPNLTLAPYRDIKGVSYKERKLPNPRID